MLKNRGYQGSFSASSLVAEGVATFFKKDRFELVKEERFDFSKLLEQVCLIDDPVDDKVKTGSLLDKKNVLSGWIL